ncbi:MAG: hypothetical protein LBV52_05940 [Spirochaetaceae bacterium]|nr:hypothetical protein [Spirochaetaceae bacterium]
MNYQTNALLKLRERTGFEACDAGILIWQKNFAAMSFVFLILLVVVAAVFLNLPFKNNILVYCGFIWFLKPVFDRFALQIIQVRFFKKEIRGRSLFKGFPKLFFTALPGDLLWRRFSAFRSVIMPLRLLENLKGKKLKARKASLENGEIKFGGFLTVFCVAAECFIFAGEITFITLLSGIFKLPYFFSITGDFSTLLFLIFYSINFIIIETLYVCAGFSIYINSRVIVEGWHLQLLLDGEAEKK